MILTRFDVWNLRVLETVTFAPGPGVNLVVGGNGSGKTSLLEALYVLSAGRSFTGASLERVMRRGAKELRLVAHLEHEGREQVLGLARQVGTVPEIHVDRERVATLARLAERFPVQVIHPQSDDLVIGGPANRRRFLDWGVFHVEHTFMPVWRDYRRILGQRNAALRDRCDAREMRAWDSLLSEQGESLSAYRERYLASLRPWIERVGASLIGSPRLELALSRGWSADLSLDEALAQAGEQDRRNAQTNLGPHRAELRLLLDGHEVRASASRGQQKLLVYTLKLAQAWHLLATADRRALLLIDDLASELDGAARERTLALVRDLALQVVVTAIERRQLDALSAPGDCRVFHVEQGEVELLV